MTRTSLPRRLLASAAGLAIGLSGALALAAPAQAVDVPGVGETVPFFLCDGTYVDMTSIGGDLVWSVTAGGDTYWPEGEDGTVESGETETVFVPKEAGDITVDYEGSGEGWPKVFPWDEPDWCTDLPEPTFTQPTCDSPGEIVIPELPDLLRRVAANQATRVEAVATQRLFYELNGDEVEPESSHPAEPGSHVVTLNYELSVPVSDDETIKRTRILKTWVIELEEPECDLPDTGTQVAFITGGALLLLTLGSAAYFLARRRRISFTA